MSDGAVQEAPRVLLSTDPECLQLEARGWRVLAESWGARLRPSQEDLPRLAHLVDRARAQGYAVRELGPVDAAAIAELDAATREDYPQAGPATAHEPVDEARAATLLTTGRAFGALDTGDHLVAVSVTSGAGERVETDFTAVHPQHRRAGLGTAVKAASVLPGGRTGHGSSAPEARRPTRRAWPSTGRWVTPSPSAG